MHKHTTRTATNCRPITQFPEMIFYLAQNPHCIIKTFLARLLLLCLLLFTSPYLPGRDGFVRLAAYRTSAAIQNISREQRQRYNPEPHSSFPFKPAAWHKILHWPRLKECQRQHLTMGSGGWFHFQFEPGPSWRWIRTLLSRAPIRKGLNWK